MNKLQEIKWFIQRGRRGWANSDVWNFNDYLCGIIAQGLRELKGGIGCPSEFFDSKKKNDNCHKWDDALETMAQGFDSAKWLGGFGYHKWVPSKYGKKLEIDLEAMENARKKMDKGLKLFAKHFLNLWD